MNQINKPQRMRILKNYLSKLLLAMRLSSNVSTFLLLILNSKRYSRAYKKKLTRTELVSATYNFHFEQKNLSIEMRTYSGDIDIFYEIFWKRTYDIPAGIASEYVTIVDLGAHIGLASIHFALRHPHSKIIAVEASHKNFELLIKNTADFPSITCIEAAVYPEDGMVLFDSSGISYNSKLSVSGSKVQALSMKSLLQEHKIDRVDLLKIDIEGAEELLLSRNNDWLLTVNCIIIEIHANYKIEHLRRDLETFGFSVFASRELHPCLKNIFALRN
jgi:FkbM family methyltransferase